MFLFIRMLLAASVARAVDQACFVIPYRDRGLQLVQFFDYMSSHEENALFIVVNQADRAPFNRASLINVGFLMARAMGCTYFTMHDVDTLPSAATRYAFPSRPTKMITALDRFGWTNVYSFHCGGVLSVSVLDFEAVNGMSNRFWGWGQEDDELCWRLRHRGFIEGLATPTPPPGQGEYFSLSDEHPKDVEARVDKAENWELLRYSATNASAWLTDGLNSLTFRVLSCNLVRRVAVLSVDLTAQERPMAVPCSGVFERRSNVREPRQFFWRTGLA